MDLELADGRPSAYGFMCGYHDYREVNGFSVDMWGDGCWHVRIHDHNQGNRVLWASFDRMGDARRAIDRGFRSCRDLPDMIRYKPNDHDQTWTIA